MDSIAHASQSYCHRTSLTAVCKKYKGIVFTHKDGNIIDDSNNDKDNTLEITGVDASEAETIGMGNDNVSEAEIHIHRKRDTR